VLRTEAPDQIGFLSKTQFHRKFGGKRRARWFKILLALAYVPRWLLTGVGQTIILEWEVQARLYQRMLVELSGF
jgi:hypothetical protein